MDRDERPRSTFRNWKDVRAEAIASGRVDEARVAEETAKLREAQRLAAVDRTAGALTGMFSDGYLDNLREDWPDKISVKLPGGRVVQAEVDDDDVDLDELDLHTAGDQHKHIFEDADGWVICVCECPECVTVAADGEPTCICPRCGHNSGTGLPAYLVTAQWHEGWYLLTAPHVPGAVSQCRDLADAEVNIREAIACVLHVAPDSFDVIIREKEE
jgi:predicted RNase H-like HicB family nuclease